MLSRLCDLPSEVVHDIFEQLHPQAFPSVRLVCRRFDELVASLNWRYLCRKHFKYWDPGRGVRERLHCRTSDTDWRILFDERQRVDRETSKLLNSVLETQFGRIDKIQRIVELGYDAKDTLLQHLAVADDADDVLARRYYSAAVLGSLHRVLAIREWSQLQDAGDVSLERALAAFDMFVLHGRRGDLDETTTLLDNIASTIIREMPRFEEQTPRHKALSVVQFLRDHNLTGIERDENLRYHDLQNNFIGIALQDPRHPSLPLISTAIFCAVAQRLGISASPCGFPLHVVSIVSPPEGRDLEFRPLSSESKPDVMYLDPFQSGDEIPISSLVSRLRLMGAAESSLNTFLSPSTTPGIVLRTSRNILASVQEFHRQAVASHDWRQHVLSLSAFPDLDGAFYGALWASLLLGVPVDGDGPASAWTPRRNYLPSFIEHFETHFPMDLSLVESQIIPLFQDVAESAQLRDCVRAIRSVDSIPKQVKRRTSDISQCARYKVGQVFEHKRYMYLAVITGWDVECGADERWMAQMRVDDLDHGRHQSFYHVLVEDKSTRYVAEENIKIVRPEFPYSLMSIAGRHFKRWDHASKSFVSNIKDEYPDD